MSTNMPSLGSGQHHASVNYEAVFGGLTTAGGKVTFANPGGTTFLFSFETSRSQPDPQLDLWDVSWDYSWFDQSSEEASIAQYLSGICGMIAELLGLQQADVEQSVTVQRVWTVAANTQGSAAAQQYSPGTITEVMPFPPQVASADAAAAAESASVAVQ